MTRRGFTLIELTVVMAIITILAAILFPVFAQARQKAHQANCAGHLEQLGTALQLYARDYDGRLPPRHNDLRPVLRGYVEDTLLSCPVDPDATRLREASRRAPAGPWYGSYQYRGGLGVEDRPDIPLAADWSLFHNQGGNTLFLDGHVKWAGWTEWIPVAPVPRPLPRGFTLTSKAGPTPALLPPGKLQPLIPPPPTIEEP